MAAAEQLCRMERHSYADRRRKTADRQECDGCLRDWVRRRNQAVPIPDWQRPPGAAEARERYAAWAAGLGAAIVWIRRTEGFDGRERRWRTLGELLVGAALAVTLLLPGRVSAAPAEAGWCAPMRITGYVRSEYSAYTYDGTSVWTPGIAAASWNIAIDSLVEVEGIGTFRVADRGHLGNEGWIDIAVDTRAEAFALTSVRTVCVTPPEEAP